MANTTSTPTWTTGDRLRKAREWANIESQDMAELLGVSRNTISNYEHDRTNPPLAALKAWAAQTGVDILWLIDEDDVRSRCFLPDARGAPEYMQQSLFTLAA